METEKLQLTAKILNSTKEIEIYQWLALVAPDYGTKPFNKRFETWLNKLSSERFGTDTIENWGPNGETKQFARVRFGFYKQDYSNKYDLSFYYLGKDVGYDFGAKAPAMRDHNAYETLIGVVSVNDIAVRAKGVIEHRQTEIEKMQHNLKWLPKLIAKRDSLRQEIEDFNDRISYAIADSVRIRAR